MMLIEFRDATRNTICSPENGFVLNQCNHTAGHQSTTMRNVLNGRNEMRFKSKIPNYIYISNINVINTSRNSLFQKYSLKIHFYDS